MQHSSFFFQINERKREREIQGEKQKKKETNKQTINKKKEKISTRKERIKKTEGEIYEKPTNNIGHMKKDFFFGLSHNTQC